MQHVNTRHREYDTFAPKWKRVRDALAGQDDVHKASEAYLPRLKNQSNEDYAAYKTRAGFYNASWRTVANLCGMMFAKPPLIELPGALDAYADDIDMAGTSLETFARKVALEVVGPGRVGILVDHPDVADVLPLSVAAAQEQGLRPMLKTYRAENIINWKYDRVRNHWRLVRVVLEETVEEPDGPFKTDEVTQWRVLELDEGGLYRQQVYRKAKGSTVEFEQVGDDIYPMIGARNLDFLPFYIIGPDGIDSELDVPPLIDLIDLNLSHYRTNADYEHGCHFTGLPTAVVSGYIHDDTNKAEFYIGSTSAWVFPDPNASAKFLEFTGTGLGSLRDNLARKEQQMAVLGARMLSEEKRAVEAAETASIHRAGENSVLASIAGAISEGVETALEVMAQWAGAGGEVVFELNRDYNPALLDAPKLTALMKSVQMGLMSEETYWSILQRGDVVDGGTTWEQEQERISQQEPPAPVAPVAANDGQQEDAA